MIEYVINALHLPVKYICHILYNLNQCPLLVLPANQNYNRPPMRLLKMCFSRLNYQVPHHLILNKAGVNFYFLEIHI